MPSQISLAAAALHEHYPSPCTSQESACLRLHQRKREIRANEEHLDIWSHE